MMLVNVEVANCQPDNMSIVGVGFLPFLEITLLFVAH